MRRLGILISGRGSNFIAIADNIRAGKLDAEIALVISNRLDAGGIEAARERGIRVVVIPSKGMSREDHDRAVIAELNQAEVDLVCLAGYMRLLSPEFIRAFPQRIINIHPSLLPAFPGLDAQQQALDYGVKVSGATVHLVTRELDGGPIVVQSAVPILFDDTVETLSARILIEEHKLYPVALRIV